MKHLLFTLLSVATLAAPSFADKHPDVAAKITNELTPETADKVLKLLQEYKHELSKELAEDAKANKSPEELETVAKNLLDIEKSIEVIQKLHHLHNNSSAS